MDIIIRVLKSQYIKNAKCKLFYEKVLTSTQNENIIKEKIAKREKRGEDRLRNEIYNDVISNTRRIIQEKGLKQAFVAERAGFSPQDFSNILNDRRKLLRIEHLPAIAKALGVEMGELFRGTKAKEVS